MNRTERAVRTCGLFEPGDKIVVGFSGGADSTALLHCLAVKCGVQTVACHINHMLRGAESDRDEEAARRFCAVYGIPFVCERADIRALAKAKGIGEEEAGRRFRYDCFERVRLQYGAQHIATAHTLSDQAETVLFRLARGSGMKGLCGIPLRRGAVIRPILGVTRDDVESYCAENGLSFVTDSSNADCRYARNRIRREVLPSLMEAEPGTQRAIARTAAILSEEEAYLAACTEQAMTELIREDGYDAEKMRVLPTALRRRAAVSILEREAGGADFAAAEALLHLLTLSSGSVTVQGGTVLSIRRNRLFREDRPVLEPFAVPLCAQGITEAGGETLVCTLIDPQTYLYYQKIYKNFLYLAVDYDTIKGKLTVRQRADGDRFAPAHRGHTRPLKKLFSEAGLSAAEKSSVLVFADDEQIVGVWGFGADRANAVTPKTKRILLIRQDRMGEDRV